MIVSPLRFINYPLGFALVTVIAGFSVNYIIDPYSVFGTKFFPEYGEPEERYLKVEYLKSHPDFNTFLLGSSRIGVIKTENVDRFFPGAKTYNLTLFQANEWDVEKHIEWLVKNIPDLSHIIVQIDWPGAYGSYRPEAPLLYEIHPDISGRNKYDFLLDYLTLFNVEALERKISSNNSGGLESMKYDITKGFWSHPLRDKKIEEDCKNYVANEKKFITRSRPVKLDSAILANSLASIARYKSLLDKKNIKLTVFLTPQNHHLIDSIAIEDYEIFVTHLVNITDFYNFMYYNKLTKNDCNYYEASHYRPVVGESIIRSLFNPDNKQRETYQFVAKSSISSHIKFLKANFFYERSGKFRNEAR